MVIFRGVAMSCSDMALSAVSCFEGDSTQITWEIQTQMKSLDMFLKICSLRGLLSTVATLPDIRGNSLCQRGNLVINLRI